MKLNVNIIDCKCVIIMFLIELEVIFLKASYKVSASTWAIEYLLSEEVEPSSVVRSELDEAM